MSLHNEHLQKALQHTPDREMVPEDSTRNAVLSYAAKVNTRKQSWLPNIWLARTWLAKIWKNMAGWPLAGLGSAMAAALVVVVFWGRSPEQEVFTETELARMADAQQAKEPAKSASSPTSLTPAPSGAAAEGVNKEMSTGTEESGLKARRMIRPESIKKPAKEVVAAAPPPAEMMTSKQEILAAPTVATADSVDASPDSDYRDKAATVERAEEFKKSDADKAVLAKDKIASSQASQSAVSADAMTAAIKRGKEHAHQDIKAGILRILVIAGSEGERLSVDQFTGYRIEAVNAAPTPDLTAEIEAYNQVMRDWYVQ